jgi:hypothetical protein
VALFTREEAKRQLDIKPDNTRFDDEIQMWSDAAQEAVEKAKGELVVQRDVTVEVIAAAGSPVILPYIPVVSLTSVASVDGSTTWDVDDLHASTVSGELLALRGNTLKGRLLITYQAGHATPPASYKPAGLIILQHLWETRRGTQGVSHGGDNEVYIPQLGYAIPRRAHELLGLGLPGVA